ncbi:MAG TPA: ATP-binding protein [Opitutaceae bacterium]|nr:ATP-binding protein [Opitutaceae bacterium]
MLSSSALFVSAFVTLLGLLILWSNPARVVNRVTFTCSLHMAAWLAFLHLALTSPRGSAEGLFWLRCTYTVSASLPLHFLLVKESIVLGLERAKLRRNLVLLGWIVVSIVLTILPFTDFFIPSSSSASQPVRGWAYHWFDYGVIILYALLFENALRTIKKVTGAQRLEIQVWLVGGCATAATILTLKALYAVTHDSIYVLLQPIVALVFFGGTAFAITTSRVFDARQLILVTLERMILVVGVAGVAYALDWGLGNLLSLSPILALVATTALALWFAVAFNGWLDRIFQFYPQATAARQAAYAVARREVKVDSLEQSFLSVLKGWGQTDHALMLSGTKGMLKGGGGEIAEDCVAVRILRQLRWATPERLAREKSTPEREALGRFLQEHRLGVVVFGEGPTLSVLIGVGLPASRRPFTYPQVTQLMELASIVESALERSHFSVKAQHAEQLATVGLLGASLAHEIRNPLVTIKTFVQLLPQHYQDAAFRDKFFRLIGDEVSRIDRLTEQLLDLASPRVYTAVPTPLHALLRAGLDLVTTKADHRQIRIYAEFDASPDVAMTDAAATKQVLLNLCFNAIHAVENKEGERWIRVATRNVPEGIEMAVSDNGPGISPEILPRLFQPFQSTKSTGFGLGLAICSDILSGLKATIAADPPRPGAGATFRVHFPCPPPSS